MKNLTEYAALRHIFLRFFAAENWKLKTVLMGIFLIMRRNTTMKYCVWILHLPCFAAFHLMVRRGCESPDGTGFASFLHSVLWLENSVFGKFTSTVAIHYEKCYSLWRKRSLEWTKICPEKNCWQETCNRGIIQHLFTDGIPSLIWVVINAMKYHLSLHKLMCLSNLSFISLTPSSCLLRFYNAPITTSSVKETYGRGWFTEINVYRNFRLGIILPILYY